MMAKYAHIKEGQVWRRFEADSVPPHKSSFLIPIIEDPKPPFNGDVQTISKIETIEQDRVAISWDVQNKPLAEVKADLKARVDVAASAERGKYTTPGKELVYDRKRREAEKVLEDATPDATKYPLLNASIGQEVPDTGNKKTDFDRIANLVLATESSWAVIAETIETATIGGKASIDAAANVTDAWAAYQAVTWSP